MTAAAQSEQSPATLTLDELYAQTQIARIKLNAEYMAECRSDYAAPLTAGDRRNTDR